LEDVATLSGHPPRSSSLGASSSQRPDNKGGNPNGKMGDIETVLGNELITVGPSIHLFGAHDLCRLQIEMWGDQAKEGEN
jgi:hypothetical protein